MIAYQIVVLALLGFFLASVFRNLRDYAPACHSDPNDAPSEKLFVLIPARNEAANIVGCLEGLLSQTWRDYTILVLDDNSDDGTGELIAALAERDSRINLLAGRPLPVSWAGKVWACSQLAEEALARGATWLLFLDADTRARPELTATLLRHGRETGAGMVSSFPYQITGSLAEQVVLPMLHFLITTLLPVRMVWESPYPNLVAACGQVELFTAEAYRQIGGHASIPESFHDGLQLARRTKALGLSVRLCDVSALISCRMYHGGKEVWNGFTRNAYEGLGSPGALLVMTVLQVVLFLGPYLFLTASLARGLFTHRWDTWIWLCAAQVSLILVMRTAQAQRFGHPKSVLLHPASIVALVAIQWASFWKAKCGAPIAWKGRAYGPVAASGAKKS